MNYNNVKFVRSAASGKDFIDDGRKQIVFAGRSNVGKSSVINRLLNRKNFARASATPGKTAHINYFLIDGSVYLADLPGYGYAKVSDAEKLRWAQLMESYFERTDLITAGVLIVDARHKPTADDVMMAQWFKNAGCPLVVLANKCDKCKKSELAASAELIRETLGLDEDDELIIFSAENGEGRGRLCAVIEGFAG